MLTSAKTLGQKFQRDENGVVHVIFGLFIIVVVLCVGLALDLGRAFHSNQRIANALDAAALAAVKGNRLEGLSKAEAEALGVLVFNENMNHSSGKWINIKSIKVDLDTAKNSAKVDVEAAVNTYFYSVIGINTIEIGKSASAVFDSKDIEVSLQLDTTASMCQPCDKIEALKGATAELIDILIPNNPSAQKVRIAISPFTAGVNAGSYFKDVNGGRNSPSTCVYERETASNQTTDAAPTGLGSLKIVSDLAKAKSPFTDDKSCPNATVLPLTDDKSKLKAKASSLQANGSTAGHLGTAWAWYMLSPNWNSIWKLSTPVANYDDSKVSKVAILMTDGEYNSMGGIFDPAGTTNAPIASQLAVDTCQAMKDKGITIYTVGFKLDPAKPLSISTMADCASGPSKALRAENAAELSAAFKAIGNSIMRLHLTN